MINDNITSFFVLRGVEDNYDNVPHPRMVPAYSQYYSTDPLVYARLVEVGIKSRDWRVSINARVKLDPIIASWSKGRHPFSIQFAPYINKLKILASDNSSEKAKEYFFTEIWQNQMEIRDINFTYDEKNEPEITNEALTFFGDIRTNLADALLAAVLCDDKMLDREYTALTISALEAIERLIQPKFNDAYVLPWESAILKGMLIYPIDLSPRIISAFGNLRKLDFNKPLNLVAQNRTPIRPKNEYIGDLIVVKQKLVKYEMGEIAHVENVLKSETYNREFRTLKRSEIRLLNEDSKESTTERDLQSTARDEFKREWATQKQDNISLQGDLGATVSGTTGTGKYVITAGASASYNRSSEVRELTSQQHVGEIVSKVQEKLIERVRTVRESVTTTENEDSTNHGFSNVGGDDHIVGVYRWIEKQYQLYLINYGRRHFYEFIIPEPANYWISLEKQRASMLVGPLPEPPMLPSEIENNALSTLKLSDFDLIKSIDTASIEVLDQPVQWKEIVKLAGEWGLQLSPPPSPKEQAHHLVSIGSDPQDKSSDLAHLFGADINGTTASWWESIKPKSTTPPEGLIKIPKGYVGKTGEIALKTWQKLLKKDEVIKASDKNAFVSENGYVTLLLGGRRYTLSIPAAGANNGAGGFVYKLENVLNEDTFPAPTFEGDIPVGLTTTLESAIFSIRLDCVRTRAKEKEWSEKTYLMFMEAYRAKLIEHEAAVERAQLENARLDIARPDSYYRGVEQNELKRAIIDMLLGLQLPSLANNVLSEAENNPVREALPAYAAYIDFFERVFDWSNLAYHFEAYFYGRGKNWSSLATAYNADSQFTIFLGAGAARVQLPCQPGFESLVNLFLTGQFLNNPTLMIPWFTNQQSIAEDLAREARDGFVLSTGRITVPTGSRLASVRGITFSDPADRQREIRIGKKIYFINNIISPDTFELDRLVETGITDLQFETGGLLVGTPIDVSLPTTLVAIDSPNVNLPEFPSRYS